MIRIPLTFHAPEVVYEYLENKFGPLNMLVKKGQALVTFDDLETNEAAISLQRGQAIVRGHPLRMFRYNDGDLNVPEPVPLASSAPPAPPAPPAAPNPDFSMMMSIQPEHSAPGLITLPAASSETAKMVDQAITVLDPNDPLQVTTRKHFKDVIQYVAKYTPLINAAKNRAKELQAGGGEGMVQELLKAHQSQLGEVKNGVMGLYKRARNQASRFGKEKQRCQIDLEPSLQPEPVESAPLYAGKLSSYLHFATKDQTVEIKRIAILNEKQFVCSSYLQQRERRKTAKGKIKVYGLDEEFQVMSTVLPEGAYGLSVIDKYLLVGNLQGSVSFWNATLGPFTPQHPFEMSQKLHEGYIFDLLRNGTAPGGFGVVTLGTDFQIKLFQVSEDLITDDIVTLFFKEEAVFSQGREIMGIDLLQERAKLVAGSYNRLITYDLPTKKVISESLQRSNIYRIKRMRENLLSLADTSSVTFADPRTNGAVASCALSQQAKALCVVNENVACYGTNDGQLGMVDMRKCSQPFWRDQGTHHSRIYDILRMGERLISGDQRGLLVGWSSAEVN